MENTEFTKNLCGGLRESFRLRRHRVRDRGEARGFPAVAHVASVHGPQAHEHLLHPLRQYLIREVLVGEHHVATMRGHVIGVDHCGLVRPFAIGHVGTSKAADVEGPVAHLLDA